MFRFRNPIRAALPCLCAFLLMGVYTLELLRRLNLTAVNLICLFLACLELFLGIIGAVNTQKAGNFASSLSIALAALAVNLRGRTPLSLSALSAWEALWTGLAAISIVCLAAVLLCLIHWSQEQWEETRRENQRLRRERIEQSRQARYEQRQVKLDQRQTWNNYHRWQTQQEIDARRRRQLEFLESRRRVEQLKRQRRVNSAREKLTDTVGGNHRFKTWIFGLTVAIILLYLLLPFAVKIPFICQWGMAIVEFGEKIANLMIDFADSAGVGKTAKAFDPVEGLAYYTLFYIALMGIIYVAFILLYRAIANIIGFIHGGNQRGSEGDSSGFFDEYGTALSVFIMSMAVLLFTTGRFNWKNTGNLFLQMLYAIFAIIILLIGIDVVRLTLRQCLEPGSFLRSNMELTFVLVIENVMGTILTVLMSLRLKSMLESILLLLFYNHKSAAHRKVEEVLEQSMDREIEAVRDKCKKKTSRRLKNNTQTSSRGSRPSSRKLQIKRWKK